MRKIPLMSIIEGCGVSVHSPDFLVLSEAAQLKVTDETLTGMLKFITDKYNALDFEDIERSAGDYNRFKYRDIIQENATLLKEIYQGSDDPGAKKYVAVADAVLHVTEFLTERSRDISAQYKMGNGVIQLMYTSLVAACIYSVGTLISNTIRFITTEQDTDCQVVFDEIPGSIKHVHIKNILSAAESIPQMHQLVNEFNKGATAKPIGESVTISGVAIAMIATVGVLVLIPRIITLIREIIYSIYYSRVKKAEMLEMQIQLLRTNIESLEAGRGNKKVIARQKAIAKKLEQWKDRISMKMDGAEPAVKKQIATENQKLHVDRNSSIVQSSYDTTNVLI